MTEFRAPTHAAPEIAEVRCFFCGRRPQDVVGTLSEIRPGEKVYACVDVDRDECVEAALRRLRDAGRRKPRVEARALHDSKRHTSFWRHRDGGAFVCETCYPPPDEKLVAERREGRP